MRRALRVGEPTGGGGSGGGQEQSGGRGRPARHYAQDGDVPVVRLPPRKDHAGVAALAKAEEALQEERAAREKVEMALRQAQATIQTLQTKICACRDRACRGTDRPAYGRRTGPRGGPRGPAPGRRSCACGGTGGSAPGQRSRCRAEARARAEEGGAACPRRRGADAEACRRAGRARARRMVGRRLAGAVAPPLRRILDRVSAFLLRAAGSKAAPRRHKK